MFKKVLKRILAVSVASLLLVNAVACGGGGGQSGPATDESAGGGGGGGGGGAAADQDRVLHVSVYGDPGSLLPTASNSIGGFFGVIRSLYDTPWNIREDGSMDYCLVESMEAVSDVEYTLHLREGVTFSNGNPFTAEDFIFTMELDRDHPQHYLNVASVDFEQTNIVDDYTIDLWLTHYDVSAWPGMAIMFIMDKESYDEQSLALTPIGTGAYELVDYVPNSSVTLRARDGFWGDPAHITDVVFDIKAEESQRVNALVTGDTQYSAIPTSEVEYIESLGDYNVQVVPSAGNVSAFFNCSPDAPLGSVEARLAVMYAINRDSIVELAYDGVAGTPNYPASNAAIGYQGHEDMFSMEVYDHGYDPDLARDYAEQSGLVGQTLTITTNGDLTYNTIAEIIQDNLREIGVEATITQYDTGSYTGTLMDTSTFDIGLLAVGCPSRVSFDMLYGYLSFLGLGWEGPERDQVISLLEAALASPDEEDQREYFTQAMEVWDTVHPWFALVEGVNPVAVSNEIGGYEYYLDACLHVADWYWVS